LAAILQLAANAQNVLRKAARLISGFSKRGRSNLAAIVSKATMLTLVRLPT